MNGFEVFSGVVVVLETNKGGVLAFKDILGENEGKKEKIPARPGDRLPVGSVQFMGGAVDGQESSVEAIVRESREEFGFELDPDRLELLSFGVPIEWEKEGGIKYFGVTIFWLLLSDQQELELRRKGAMEVSRLDGELRERDRVIYDLYQLTGRSKLI